MEHPSITEEPDMLEEKDMGEAGSRIYDSLLKLVLLCNCETPESAELASVTRELAPTLGPEVFPVLLSIWLISLEAGPRPEQRFADIELPVPRS